MTRNQKQIIHIHYVYCLKILCISLLQYIHLSQLVRFLARLFRRNSRTIVIARSSSLSSSSYKNFNVAHYSKSIKYFNTFGINTKLEIHGHHDKMQMQDKRHNSESYSFRVMSPFNLFFSRMMTPDRRTLVPHAVLLLPLIAGIV